ncbi:amino acid permease, partial [Escherichia coli]|nr:amino acid permease [Escherichia coli]
MMLAGSRLLYSFGRDGLLPSWLSHLNDKHLPNRALVILTIIGVLIGSMFPFAFLAQLISAGTLVAFMFVSLAMYRLRKREGKDLPIPAFKLPLYPVLPAVTFVLVLLVFWGLGFEAKLYT